MVNKNWFLWRRNHVYNAEQFSESCHRCHLVLCIWNFCVILFSHSFLKLYHSEYGTNLHSTARLSCSNSSHDFWAPKIIFVFVLSPWAIINDWTQQDRPLQLCHRLIAAWWFSQSESPFIGREKSWPQWANILGLSLA